MQGKTQFQIPTKPKGNTKAKKATYCFLEIVAPSQITLELKKSSRAGENLPQKERLLEHTSTGWLEKTSFELETHRPEREEHLLMISAKRNSFLSLTIRPKRESRLTFVPRQKPSGLTGEPIGRLPEQMCKNR